MTENQALPTATIEIGGKEYTLLYSILAFAKLKQVANLNALKGEVDFYDPNHLLYFLWAGLISCHEEFDGNLIDGKPDAKLSAALRQIGSVLTINKMNEIAATLKRAFVSATGATDKDSKKSEAKKGEKKP